MTGTPGLSAIAVVVPVHDEEGLLEACLSALERASRRVAGLPVATFVVLDACSDRSAAIAAEHRVEMVVIEARNVGAARGAGTRAAIARFGAVSLPRLWIAHTDADSVVPENWLEDQRTAAASGVDVLVGTVHPDFHDLDDRQRSAWIATHSPGVANGHVHGANLGTRASALMRVGGFEPLAEHEDVRLVERVREQGGRIDASARAGVRTSGRNHGRTPGGYARYLREELVPFAKSTTSIPDV